MKNREELGERGSMSMYKDVKKRILAGVLAALMVVSTLSIGSNLFADYTSNIGETLLEEGQYAQIGSATKDYQRLDRAAMKVDIDVAQSVDYTVSVYQNLADASDPTSGVLRYTSAQQHMDGTSESASARELSLEEIREIRAHIPDDMEIETFIHGAMCISYSGRCLLSNFMAGRDANQGACTHPCRWKYSVVEEKRPGEYMPVFENERGTFIFNSKDLCMVEHMEDILTSGIDSLKIEGRMKTALYVATVARTYRKAIDDCMESPEKYHANMPWYQEQISNCTYRQFTTGFFYGKPDENTQIYDSNTYVREYTYLGFAEEIDERGLARLTQRNKFSVGETIEIMKPDGRNIPVTVEAIYNEEGESMESAPHAQQRIYLKLNETPEVFDILRRGE